MLYKHKHIHERIFIFAIRYRLYMYKNTLATIQLLVWLSFFVEPNNQDKWFLLHWMERTWKTLFWFSLNHARTQCCKQAAAASSVLMGRWAQGPGVCVRELEKIFIERRYSNISLDIFTQQINGRNHGWRLKPLSKFNDEIFDLAYRAHV